MVPVTFGNVSIGLYSTLDDRSPTFSTYADSEFLTSPLAKSRGIQKGVWVGVLYGLKLVKRMLKEWETEEGREGEGFRGGRTCACGDGFDVWEAEAMKK